MTQKISPIVIDTGATTTGSILKNVSGTATWSEHTLPWGKLTGTLADQTDLKNALDGKASLAVFTAAVNGLVPAPVTASGKFLKDDGTWGVPTDAAAAWGSITGTLSSQTDLQSALDGKLGVAATAAAATKLATARTIALSGGISGLGVSFDGTANISISGDVANDHITNARLADMATQTFKGRNTALAGDPEDLTVATVRTMLSINNVDNTSDANKPVSTAQQTALDAKINATEKGAANGVATLGADSKIPSAQLPALALTDVHVVATQTAQLALVAQEGDVAVRTDLNKSFIHNGGTAATMADWQELLTPTDQVLSVNGYTGAVTLAKADVGLGNVDNTSDASKPVSTAQQSALDLKLNTSAYTASDVLTKLLTVDGATSGLDADLLDGQHGSYYNDAANLTGTVAVARLPALTGGDVTSAAGSSTLSIGANKVTLSHLAQVATATFLGRTTALAGNVEALTAAQATALLNAMVGANGTVAGTKGLVPAPAATDNGKYLRGDATWQTLDKTTVGLGNVDNTSDANKPVSTAQQTALDAKINATEKGAASGVATLDANSKVPAAQLPQGWAPVSAVGTGASQNIALPSAVAAEEVLVFVEGVHQRTGYTITGSTLTTTQPNGYNIAIYNVASLGGSSDTVRTIKGFHSGTVAASKVIAGEIASHAFGIVQANCVAKAMAAATASTTFEIKKDGVVIGSFNFAAGQSVATFTITANAIAVGNMITVHGPASADTTLSDVAVLLRN